MARFAVGQSITTREPAIEVDAGLALGAHRFSLVVVDASGRRSAPDVVIVRVQRLDVPPIDRPPEPTPVPFGGGVRPPGGPIRPATGGGRLQPTNGAVRPRGIPARSPGDAPTPRVPAAPKRKRSEPK